MSSVDFAIIGGGVAGVSAAAELSALGSVLLFEAEQQLGYHASGRSAAMFLPCYGNAVVRAMNEASADAHEAAGVLSPRRFLVVAPDSKRDAFDADVAELGLTRIGPDDAVDILPILNPDWLADAATLPAWDLDTDLLIQTYRRRALAQGARIETGARVTGIAHGDGGWQITWNSGAARAANVVNAAGAWADTVATMAGLEALRLIPHRRSVAQLAAPGGHDVSDWPFVEEVGEAWYAKPDAGRWLVSPADADPVDPGDAWADDMVLAEGLARYQDAVTEEVTRPLHSWAGLRTFAHDKTLVIGPDPRAPGFWWLAGQGGYGFQTAPAAARHLAERVDGRAPALGAQASTALDPERLVQTAVSG
ncbi:bifunctional tRNA (mnm(5)s(2)U34)-methyltransferase/FAD-dependent cmnm(5)s(2)U34 oxidoreductase [Rhodobacteraceae bacterium THAF1]|uniref:NAD(P)/FAD-dependent oxidoreductase n=1 Tax=Palleronia sp. THAF1 TaxID=2587842 RepID=UPI000F3B5DF2|nr:FAD-dependent oxidoreductase [Palleronia sp. THAF1]QFU07722.1 bifunctional tRNA (mnm(5)s(2)U34)-methyltransferase/FAD-dependent cmnm(5)s(2)U34 oxidoreductase [Palleronia sp. THAF1]VDC23194.1 bifunctional tRNA (mnm(5)s(2)U34)-methyltransferase/FAD-dependent cmnm(5)s(2)U34 oxidoreductase [Rhodobacteraceae bacterium THAF1]